METKPRRLLSAVLTVIMAFALLTAFPLMASAEDGPIRVTIDPVGAIYQLNATAVPLKAIFYYNTLNEQLIPDANAPLTIQWYWSATDSNTDRSNGLGENQLEDWYGRIFEIPTTIMPATDTVGVRYYYAVLSYSIQTVAGAVVDIERETVTNTARIEVIDSQESRGSITVLKTDENGAPLAGATIRVEGLAGGVIPRVYDVVTDSNGEATFVLEEGEYYLSEYAAPTGYNPSGDSYKLLVLEDGVYIQYGPNELVPYTPLTFVNMPLPVISDDHFAFVQGYPDGTFGPGRYMTRAEAVVMFANLLTESIMGDDDTYKNDYYPDVLPTDWYSNQIGYMQSQLILVDYSRDGLFRPEDPVTRAEFATLASHFDNLTLSDTNEFSDVPDDHWAVKYINSAAAKKWIEGYIEDGERTFKPENYITRAEVVTLTGSVTDRHADAAFIAANISSLPRTYPDVTTLHWAYLPIMEASIGHDYNKDAVGEHWTSVYP